MLQRNVLLLICAQACYLATVMTVFTFAGLVGLQLASDPKFATLPVSIVAITTALSTAPISLLMQAKSRRFGFRLGAFSGALGATLGIGSIVIGNFYLLCVAMLFMGPFQASAQYYRFAAAESVPKNMAPRAISWVLLGGIAAAFIVPVAVETLEAVFTGYAYMGAFAWILLATLIIFIPFSFLKPIDAPLKVEAVVGEDARPLIDIIKTPKFIAAVTNCALGYAMMSFVMTATPIAMNICGFGVGETAQTIQWHMVAMFLPGLFSGVLIGRIGLLPVLFSGHLLFIVALWVGLSGIELLNFNVALIALGVGWNFCLVGGTSLLTQVHRESEKGRVQGVNETLVFGFSAVASLSAGIILDAYGWTGVNQAGFIMLSVAVIVTLWWGAVDGRTASAKS